MYFLLKDDVLLAALVPILTWLSLPLLLFSFLLLPISESSFMHAEQMGNRWRKDADSSQTQGPAWDFKQGGLHLRTWVYFLRGILLVRFVLQKGSVTAKGEKWRKCRIILLVSLLALGISTHWKPRTIQDFSYTSSRTHNFIYKISYLGPREMAQGVKCFPQKFNDRKWSFCTTWRWIFAKAPSDWITKELMANS